MPTVNAACVGRVECFTKFRHLTDVGGDVEEPLYRGRRRERDRVYATFGDRTHERACRLLVVRPHPAVGLDRDHARALVVKERGERVTVVSEARDRDWSPP